MLVDDLSKTFEFVWIILHDKFFAERQSDAVRYRERAITARLMVKICNSVSKSRR